MAKVSIGVPVYNGAVHIRRALDSLLAQSFRDFELIISDNASTDDTREICQEYERKDSRVRYVRQKRNLGPIRNFDFLLNQSKGEYFMWAAHDDVWDSRFLETMVHEFAKSDDSVVAVGCEAQYTVDTIKQPFFREGVAFYDVLLGSAIKRVSYVLHNGYGNLFYSLFKRECLFLDGESALSGFSQVSLNELPFFIAIAFQGNWKIISDVYFYKETTPPTYAQARWEMVGGRLPFCGFRHFISGLLCGSKYHILTLIDVLRAIGLLKLSLLARIKLWLQSASCILGHFILCLLHYKKKARLGIGKYDNA
jgi:glycosyltransferase involved in cell wall biosynthesis